MGVAVPERVVSEADSVEGVLEAVPEGVAAALADVEPETEVDSFDEEDWDEALDAGQARQLVSYSWPRGASDQRPHTILALIQWIGQSGLNTSSYKGGNSNGIPSDSHFRRF